jgi:hypothetical protein
MANINQILARAAALRDETALNSIDPERAGGIMYDTLIALNELWLQQGAALVISKIYASAAAMQADTSPVSDLTGKPIRSGMIVVIASSDANNGSVYRYNGSASWSLVGKIGNIPPEDSLNSDSTVLALSARQGKVLDQKKVNITDIIDSLESESTSAPLAAHQGKVLDGKISQLGQDVKDTYGEYIDNPEWAQVVTDSNDKILYGVKTDGKFYFGDGCPPQVVEYVTAKLEELEGDFTILLNTKVDKVIGKSLIDSEFASSQEVITNTEYLQVTTDSVDKILEGIKQDGTKVIKVPLEIQGLRQETIDNPEFTHVIVDKNDKILFAFKKDGEPVFGVGVPKSIIDFVQDYVAAHAQSVTITDVSPTNFKYDFDTISWDSIILVYSNGERVTIESGAYLVTGNKILVYSKNENSVLERTSIANVIEGDVVLLEYQLTHKTGVYEQYSERYKGGLLMPYILKQEIDRFTSDCELNVWRKTMVLQEIPWTPKADVKSVRDVVYYAGVPAKGIPYSSVKECMKFVGVDVSLHTFMTAVNDEHSLLYTENVLGTDSRSAYGITYHGINCNCYYGNVCSAFMSNVLGFLMEYSSWDPQKGCFDLFYVLDNQDEENLRVGDMIATPGHVAIVSRIIRDEMGATRYIYVSEQAVPIVTRIFTPEKLKSRRYDSDAVYCRYKYLERNTNYKPTTFCLGQNEKLYKERVDYVYRDVDTTRVFYKCATSNSDSSFTPAHWTQIEGWEQRASGNGYERGETASLGESLYMSLVDDNTSMLSDTTAWMVMEDVFEWTPYPYVYNNDIVTFAGDRAAFKPSDLIYINYTKGSYTKMQIFKDGSLIQTIVLDVDSSVYQVNVSSYCATAGKYKARLINDDASVYSRYTYYEVVDTTHSFSYQNDVISASFSSSNGTPIYIGVSDISGLDYLHYEITSEDIKNGGIKINPLVSAAAQILRRWYTPYVTELFVRIVFKGEYGNVVTEKYSIGTLGDPTAIQGLAGMEVYPNIFKDFGVISSSVNIILASRLKNNNYSFSIKAYGNDLSVNVLASSDELRWANTLPSTLTDGAEYYVTINNGIGNVMIAN